MHDCQKFREDWMAATAEASVECVECRRFCDEADAILLAAAAAEHRRFQSFPKNTGVATKTACTQR
jgi:hypothetical protein